MEATLDVLFQIPNGGEVVKTFKTRPLGCEFFREMPLTVTAARSEASELGVERNWIVKAVGGRSLAGLDYNSAFKIFKEAVGPLKQDMVLRENPNAHVADLGSKVGFVPAGEVREYLQRFGYSATSESSWEAGAARPDLLLGPIHGHSEKNNTSGSTHTWYTVHGSLSNVRGSQSKATCWQVERRLVHLRMLLHDPLRIELGSSYDSLFSGAHFAHRSGPRGTTTRLESWLGMLAKQINVGRISPKLVAMVLRSLEAPELERHAAREAFSKVRQQSREELTILEYLNSEREKAPSPRPTPPETVPENGSNEQAAKAEDAKKDEKKDEKKEDAKEEDAKDKKAKEKEDDAKTDEGDAAAEDRDLPEEEVPEKCKESKASEATPYQDSDLLYL